MKHRPERGTVLSYSLPRKLLVIFLAFALTVYAVGMTVTHQLKKQALQDTQNEYRDRLTQLSNQFSEELERIRAQAAFILTRSCVQQMELVTASVQFSEYYDAVRQTSELMHALQYSSGLIRDAVIFFPRLGKSVSYDSLYDTITADEYHFLTEYQKRTGRSVFMTVQDQLYLVADSMRFANKTNSAVLVVEFSDDAMAEWCSLFPDENAVCALCSSSPSEEFFALGTALPAPQQADLCADLSSLIREQAHLSPAEKPPAEVPVRLGDVEYLRFLRPVASGNLWVAGYVKMASLRLAGQPLMTWQVIFTLFLILELLLFLYMIHCLIAKPIARFVKEVTQLQAEGIQFSPGGHSGDMDFLYQSFMEVSSQLKQSMEQAYRSQLMVYQSEIKFIQAQVRPHFLYNSFYHLYRMAKMEDNEGVAEMSLRLSSYYRYITRSDENVVPLQMEYLNAADYVEIQKIRFGERIQVEMEPLPAAFQNLPVPRFVLQPLFENAYNHGVEKITGGRIIMRFVSSPEALTILVENNGACLQSDLDALVAYLNCDEPGEKITALKNVRGRMRLLGGDLSVSRGSLGGFCAALTLRRPAKEEDGCKPS